MSSRVHSDRMISGEQWSTNSSVERPQLDITQGYDDTSFPKLFIDVYKHSFRGLKSARQSIDLIVQTFIEQYNSWIACKNSMVSHVQAVTEWKYEKTFEPFVLIMGAFTSMNKQLLALQNKAWVADANEVGHFIETWWCIWSRHGGPEKSISLRHMGGRWEGIW